MFWKVNRYIEYYLLDVWQQQHLHFPMLGVGKGEEEIQRGFLHKGTYVLTA